MKTTVLTLAALTLIASSASAQDEQAEATVTQENAAKAEPETRCIDELQYAREEGDTDLTRRAPNPLIIYAVAQEIEGCQVLVVANGNGDYRPLPDPLDNADIIFPAQ